jgi:PEGA domain
MFFPVIKISSVVSSFLLVLTLLIVGPVGTVEAAALIEAPSANPPTLTPVQYYPYRYPPGYYPPTPDTYQGTRGTQGSGWIFIEVDPPEAAVYIDGHKLEPREDNTYEEGVLAGRHKVEAKKGGYRDFMRFIDVHPGAKENLTINLRRIE